MFDNATVQAVAAIAARLNVEPAALLAVAEVESGGKPFARVNGRDEPLIRWEGHYFDRRLSGTKRAAARKAGLASPTAGAIPNPTKQEDRWKILNRAAELDAKAAFESASYGVGQVMGSHWQSLGFGSVTELVNLCRESVAGQIEVMARFIEKNKLAAALRAKNWPAFARGYNGSGYAKNAYDKKMATAYAKWAKKGIKAKSEPRPPVETPVKDMAMSLGDSGPLVEELQRNLNTLGMSVSVTGKFDEATETSVMAFQSLNKDEDGNPLKVDGKVGHRTSKAIERALLKPKIEEAKKTVPPAADKAVKEESGLLKKIGGWLTGLGIGAGGIAQQAFGADYRTVLAIGGVALAGLAIVGIGYLIHTRLSAKFNKVNAEAKS